MIKVAIAEDDFRVAGIHQEFLSQIQDLEIVGKAMNGEETLALLERTAVDLLLLDIYMPDKLGTELLPVIRQRHPLVDIVIITAATDVAILKDSLSYGVFDYIIKPLKMERFIETIETYKQKKSLLDASQEVSQKTIDQFFVSGKREKIDQTLPKGIDSITLEKIKDIFKNEISSLTAEEAGDKIGASRTTARRYLEYLASIGEVKAELEYGIVGRPERIYRIP